MHAVPLVGTRQHCRVLPPRNSHVAMSRHIPDGSTGAACRRAAFNLPLRHRNRAVVSASKQNQAPWEVLGVDPDADEKVRDCVGDCGGMVPDRGPMARLVSSL